MAWTSFFDEMRGHGIRDGATGKTWFPAGYDEYGNPTGYVDDMGNVSQNPAAAAYSASADPWQSTWMASYANSGAGGLTPNDPSFQYGPAMDWAKRYGMDPAQSLQWFNEGVQGANGSLFAGATDFNNQALGPGYGIHNMLQQSGNLTPENMAALNQYVDEGNRAKDQRNAEEKAGDLKALTQWAAMTAGVFGAGFGGLYNGLNYGVVPEAGWTSGFDLPMGGLEYFGNVAEPAAAGASGGWAEGGTVADWTSGFDLIDPLLSSTDSGVSFQRALLEQLGVNPFGYNTGATAAAQTALDGLGASLPGVSLWDNILNGSKMLSSLFGGSGGGLNLGGLIGKGVDLTAALGPSLAAINYAQNQSPFDTSQLQNAYNNIGAQTYNYDLNTNAGLNQLTSNLQRRGVMGSSFGNMDITNYNTSRELGRNDLITQGARAQAGVANDILNAQVKERLLKNDLYGRALSSIGTAVGGLR